jgi:lipopolysaccharide/colanic/teichoic acid biosynthesis glycosyltransferase
MVETILNIEQRNVTFNQGQLIVPSYFGRKAYAARLLGAVLLVVAGPLIALLVGLVRCTSSGPGLYRQQRTGRLGKEFMMYKIRTMYKDAESISGPTWCIPGDSRITPVGRVLRFLHLDELPQLINVVRGEMDLIGPRPERQEIVADLESHILRYWQRHLVLPGMTGLAQINLPPDLTVECVRRKLVLDVEYIRRANLWLDVRVLICTVLRVIGLRYHRAAPWLGLDIASLHRADPSNAQLTKLMPRTAGPARSDAENVASVGAPHYVADYVGAMGEEFAVATEVAEPVEGTRRFPK